MPEYCTCGAQLPPDARFCHKCGKPQYDYPEPEPEPIAEPVAAVIVKPVETPIGFRNRTAVHVSIFATLVAFLLIAFPLPPLIAVIRLFVCFLAAGYFAVYVYKRRTRQTITVRAGAHLGWMTGIFSFTIAAIMVIATLPSAATFRAQLMGKDPSVDQFIRTVDDRTIMVGVLLFTLVFLFALFNLLPTLGGALCAKVLEKD